MMNYEHVKKLYSYLTTAELEAELKYRTAHGSSYMVGAECCDVSSNVRRACRELLDERKEGR